MKEHRGLERTMLTILLGAVGGIAGLVLGFLLITFNFYIGRSGYTGREYAGFGNPPVAWMLAMSGGLPLGMLLTPIVYFRHLHGRPPAWNWSLLPVLTLLGGTIGAVGGLGFSALLGVGAFWTCAAILGSRREPQEKGWISREES